MRVATHYSCNQGGGLFGIENIPKIEECLHIQWVFCVCLNIRLFVWGLYNCSLHYSGASA